MGRLPRIFLLSCFSLLNESGVEAGPALEPDSSINNSIESARCGFPQSSVVGDSQQRFERQDAFDQMMSFIESELPLASKHGSMPEPCQDFGIVCGGVFHEPCVGAPACVDWEQCKMKIPVTMCKFCFSGEPGRKTSEEIQACSRRLNPEIMGCNTPHSLFDICVFRHEGLHTTQNPQKMRLCKAEEDAWSDTVACMESWCSKCPGKCDSPSRQFLGVAGAAVKMSQCACERDLLVSADFEGILEVLGTNLHCAICRASCGLSLECAFHPGDICHVLERVYCRDFPHHQQMWSGAGQLGGDGSP